MPVSKCEPPIFGTAGEKRGDSGVLPEQRRKDGAISNREIKSKKRDLGNGENWGTSGYNRLYFNSLDGLHLSNLSFLLAEVNLLQSGDEEAFLKGTVHGVRQV